MNVKELIEQSKTALGIEFGSTRIKGILADYDGNVLATGGHAWENALVDGVWTYDRALRALQSLMWLAWMWKRPRLLVWIGEQYV